MNTTIQKGDIFFVNIEQVKDSRIQGGYRPVLIVSNNICCKVSPTIQYVPLTSKSKRNMPTHVKFSGFGLKSESTALCEQVTTFDKSKLEQKVGNVSQKVLEQIDKALAIQFGLCA